MLFVTGSKQKVKSQERYATGRSRDRANIAGRSRVNSKAIHQGYCLNELNQWRSHRTDMSQPVAATVVTSRAAAALKARLRTKATA